MLVSKRLLLVTILVSQSIFSVPPQQAHFSTESVKRTVQTMPRVTGLVLLAACAAVVYGVYRSRQPKELFYPGLCDVRTMVNNAVLTGNFDAAGFAKAQERLKKDCDYVDAFLQSGAAPSKSLIKSLGTSEPLYRSVRDEVGALALWVDGYEAYERDLADNFKYLPNDYVHKPDFKKLYEELGIITENGKELSFDEVFNRYNERCKALKEFVSSEDFEQYCFRPYLRVLQLVFRSELHKRQYDAYVEGKDVYDAKIAGFKDNAGLIKEFFANQLSLVNLSIEMLKQELSNHKQKQD